MNSTAMTTLPELPAIKDKCFMCDGSGNSKHSKLQVTCTFCDGTGHTERQPSLSHYIKHYFNEGDTITLCGWRVNMEDATDTFQVHKIFDGGRCLLTKRNKMYKVDGNTVSGINGRKARRVITDAHIVVKPEAEREDLKNQVFINKHSGRCYVVCAAAKCAEVMYFTGDIMDLKANNAGGVYMVYMTTKRGQTRWAKRERFTEATNLVRVDVGEVLAMHKHWQWCGDNGGWDSQINALRSFYKQHGVRY